MICLLSKIILKKKKERESFSIFSYLYSLLDNVIICQICFSASFLFNDKVC